jgi:hypothetical protein
MVQKDASRSSTQSVILIKSAPKLKYEESYGNFPGIRCQLCQAARAENPEDMCVCDTYTAAYWNCIWRTPADRDLKMSCIDASRRQLYKYTYNLREKLGSKLFFF